MKALVRIVCAALFLAVGLAPSAHAQIDTGVEFTTSFPFYAENTKLPAGSYTVRQADTSSSFLQIESRDGKYSAFLDYIPTRTTQPHNQSDVTFRRYGNVEYLNRIWVEGNNYGIRLEPTKAEKRLATGTKPVEHNVKGKKHA